MYIGMNLIMSIMVGMVIGSRYMNLSVCFSLGYCSLIRIMVGRSSSKMIVMVIRYRFNEFWMLVNNVL